jgi:hypothetical protein
VLQQHRCFRVLRTPVPVILASITLDPGYTVNPEAPGRNAA